MTRGTILTRVRSYLDRVDLDNKIRSWIEDTRLDLALKYPFKYLYVEATASTTAGQAKYAMPTDYLGHVTLWSGPKMLVKIFPREFDELTKTDMNATGVPRQLTTEPGTAITDTSTMGPPDYYVERGMEFELYPTPDQAYVLRIKYFATPTAWVETSADDGSSDYITTFHPEAVIWGSALRGAIYLDDEVKKQNFSSAYDAAIKEMIRREKYTETEDQHVRFKTWKDYDPWTFKRMQKVTVV